MSPNTTDTVFVSVLQCRRNDRITKSASAGFPTERTSIGSVVISVDAELGWGFHDLADPPKERLAAARDGWRTLVDLFDRYDVPATWAVVGHLFLEACDGRHDDHPTPPSWFESERTRWANRPDLRFGRDLISTLLDADADHDVGCHTFSHVIFDDPRLTREMVRAELRLAQSVAEPYDVSFESFVFPRNAVGYRDVLADCGYSVYRGDWDVPTAASADGRRSSEGSGVFQGIRDAVETLGSVADPDRIPLVEPTVDEYGMVNLPASLFLFGFEGMPRRVFETVAVDPIVRQATHGIDRACHEDGVFHLWLHPNNIVTARDVARLRTIFEHIDARRREGRLRVETMASAAAAVR